ncbi:MAG: hypothetical protein EP298_09825 [Gammaproteobacteria bacterium]|nr:MAG: hypothetical protein EP298_09825 [Gammaproteobacteria bacterium]UTW43489.1 hypothetical protein KFE69_05190 [bacterium SCSIO 12844]
MKTICLSIINCLIGLLIIFLSLGNVAFSSANYSVYIRNNTNFNIKIEYNSSSYCISNNKAEGLPLTIGSQQEETFSFEDDNGLFGDNCTGENKALGLIVTVQDTTTGDQIGNIWLDHYMNIIDYMPTPSYPYETPIYAWQSRVTNPSGNIGPVTLSSALCDASDCLNQFVDASGDGSYMLTFDYDGGEISSSMINAVGLGDITVTNGYGKPISSDGAVDLNTGKYVIHFSKTQAECTFNGGLLKCDPGVGYSYVDHDDSDSSNDSVVFMCNETTLNENPCPWLVQNTASNTETHDIY